ncbi:MAG TPA: TrmO family methyltransferase [Pyrinomonadaceae bacterium]|nr:TrmO family methyltransferase [Pyrinomonadaceae bacterium]
MMKRTKNTRGAQLRPMGVIRSRLKQRSQAPMQGFEGAPDAWIELTSFAARALDGLHAGDDVIVLTWLNRTRRDVLMVYPTSDRSRALTGVFATRSPDRPNPIGLHRVDIKPVLSDHSDW